MNGVYQLKKIIKDTALMEDDYHCFLMNVKTNEIIGKLENKEFLYDKDETIVRDRFYFLGRKGLTSIYDAKKEQFVLQDCHKRFEDKDFYFFTDKDEKWHIFNIKNLEGHTFNNTSFDEVQYLTTGKNFYGDVLSYYSLTKNDKKAFFIIEGNYLSSFLYDDIIASNQALIFTEGRKKWFQKADGVLYSDENKVLYDRIKIDENGFAYGFNGDSIDIYEDSPIGYQSLFYTTYYDEIHFFQKRRSDCASYDDEFLFEVKKDGYCGIIVGKRKKTFSSIPECQNLFDLTYDYIDKDEFNTGFILEKNGKKGYLNFDDEKYSLPIEYDAINIVNYYYQLFAITSMNGKTSIIKFLKDGKIFHLVDDINLLSQENGLIFYQKNQQNHLLYLEKFKNCSSENLIFEDLSNCSKVGNCYLITQKGKKGLIYPHHFIIPPHYKEIELDFVPSGNQESDEVIFSLETAENQHFLGSNLRNPETGCFNFNIHHEKSYLDIELNHGIAVLKDKQNTYIQSYYGELLKTFPRDTKVKFLSHSLDFCIYFIHGEFYKYSFKEYSSSKKSTFALATSEDIGLCVRAYQRFDEMIIVNGYDDKEMNSFYSNLEKEKKNVSEVVDNLEKMDHNSFTDTNLFVKKLSLKPLK